jgi:hypothetical protein
VGVPVLNASVADPETPPRNPAVVPNCDLRPAVQELPPQTPITAQDRNAEPRFISEEESNRVSAQLRKQASEGKISRKNAAQKIVEMQQANTMAHIEKSVKEGKTTRAEADALLKARQLQGQSNTTETT